MKSPGRLHLRRGHSQCSSVLAGFDPSIRHCDVVTYRRQAFCVCAES